MFLHLHVYGTIPGITEVSKAFRTPETLTYEENLEAAFQASAKTSGLTEISYET